MLRHPQLNADPTSTFRPNGITEWRANPLTKLFGDSLFFDRGDAHATVRRVIAARFTPPALAKLTPMIEEVVARRLAVVTTSLESDGQVDIVGAYARPVPIEVACAMLDLPLSDAPRLSQLLLAGQFGAATFDSTPEQLEALGDVGRELTEYLGDRLSDARPDSVLGEIATAGANGQISNDQARALSFVLLAAGFETTSNLIANAVHLVLSHRLDVGSVAIDGLIDETLRYDAPVQLTARGVDSATAIDVAGTRGEPGTMVLVLLGAAGRDDRAYDDPHRFDPERFAAGKGTKPPISFGSGIHHCVGHHLARQQAALALTSLLPVLSRMELRRSATGWRPLLAVRSLESLTVSRRAYEGASTTERGNLRRLQKQRRRSMNRMLTGVVASRAGQRVRQLVTPKSRRAEIRAVAAKGQAERAAETFGELRGVMMKYGQLFSYAAPAMEPDARSAMAALQDSVKPMEPGVAERLVAHELRRPIERLFATFETLPVAAASIGQVHRGTLPDGMAVAVKVQYEGIADAVAADLAELERSQKLLARFVMRNLDAKTLAAELAARINEELDYESEAAHQIGFAKAIRRASVHPCPGGDHRSVFAARPDLRVV